MVHVFINQPLVGRINFILLLHNNHMIRHLQHNNMQNEIYKCFRSHNNKKKKNLLNWIRNVMKLAAQLRKKKFLRKVCLVYILSKIFLCFSRKRLNFLFFNCFFLNEKNIFFIIKFWRFSFYYYEHFFVIFCDFV